MNTTSKLFRLAVFVVIASIPGCYQAPSFQQADLNKSAIEALIKDLPTDSMMRADLSRGYRGAGIHYGWMDEMKKAHVKRVKVYLKSYILLHPVNIKVENIIFFNSYDINCSQVTDPTQLRQIKNSTLNAEIERVAKNLAAYGMWFDNAPKFGTGLAIVELADNEWIPMPGSATLIPYIGPDKRFFADGDLLTLREKLAQGKLNTDKLNGALMDASLHLDDTCYLSELIKNGSNPNIHNIDKETPLMMAALSGASHDVRVLLEAGADVCAKTASGQTALDIALKRDHSNIVELLTKHDH